jgi:Mg2+/Co2+ transporter CorB
MGILFFIFSLLVVSAFFSLAETGITAASRGKIYKLKLEGSKRASQAISLLDRKDRLITTILLSNTAVNMAASALVTAFLIATFGDSPEVILYATVIMTLSILIFSEVLPKVFALKNPEKVALWTAPSIFLCMFVLYPIAYTVEKIVDIMLRVCGIEKHGMEGVVHGLDALRGALELYHEEGDVVKDDKDMLGSILDLDNTEVSSIMQHRKDMETLDIANNPAEILKEVLKSNYSRMPVYSESPENIIGILHAKMLLRKLAENDAGDISQVDIKSLLSEPWFVPDSTSLKEQLIAFREKKQHFALVVDEYGSLMGMITLEDILEEIVGNIDDEYDIDYNLIEDAGEGAFIIDGTIPVRDLNREMHWKLPTDIATTVAGLIISETEMIPLKGQVFNFHGFRFEILKKKRNQITKIKISKSSH